MDLQPQYNTFSGQKPAQRTDELAQFIRILRREGVKSYLEIGSRNGDSFHDIGLGLLPGSRLVSIDLPEGPWGESQSAKNLQKAVDDLNLVGRSASVIFGDSRDPRIIEQVSKEAPFDAIFIDGDHSLEGVVLDWINYRNFSNLIAFHDIAPGHKAIKRGIRVQLLWKELKDKYRCVEIRGREQGMGIGVLYL
jgi:predicted O-methyltransferase YrrM